MEIPPKDQFDRIFALIDELDLLPESQRPGKISDLRAAGEQTQVLTYIRLNYSLPVTPDTEFRKGDRIAGHYTIRERIGTGGMGIVYRAEQDQTGQSVAIKLIRPRLSTPSLLKRFAEEITTLGKLDHPNIVKVLDADVTKPGDRLPDTLFLVMQYVEGKRMHKHLEAHPNAEREAMRLLTQVCDGLDYVHDRGIVHRDIKPGNIVVRPDGRPVIVDFGISLSDRSYGDEDESVAGTPIYMSPEIARAEGHLVDGRSDIFSVGVILYQFLAGRHPFPEGDDLLERIINVMPPTPRGDPEIARICMKAISKRATDRFQNARLFAEDLEHFLGQDESELELVVDPDLAPKPNGLRAFGADDHERFVSLLPGPKDRSGLPESLVFWKKGISSRERDVAFRAGVIYGPSGSGKSSLLNAGILPRLDDSIAPIHIDGDARRIEEDLLAHCEKHFPECSKPDTAAARLAQIRRLADGRKTLIVIDQFEQWLHAWDGQNCPLVEALRQCDGVSVQCVLIVRDEFWRPVTQFLRAIEVDLRPTYNAALVDLFDREHAIKVLGLLGRASGKLPPAEERTVEQQEFIKEVIRGLEKDGLIVPVHLALFCQMFEKHDWNSAELEKVGGISGLGLKFLDGVLENPENKDRKRQDAVKSILRSILPPDDSDIRASSKTLTELARASGSKSDSDSFEGAVSMLDKDFRLLTPIVDEEKDAEPSYKLTHDYLVPTIRKWFHNKQSSTRRGRAELQLNQLATAYKNEPVWRNRPSPLEWLKIRSLTRKSRWTDDERLLMKHSYRRKLVGAAILAIVITIITIDVRLNRAANEVVLALLTARTEKFDEHMEKFEKVRRRGIKQLDRVLENHDPDDVEYLHAELVRLKGNPERLEAPWRALQTAKPEAFEVIFKIVVDAGPQVRDALDSQIQAHPTLERIPLLRWLLREQDDASLNSPVAEWAMSQPVADLVSWIPLLRPSGARLKKALVEIVQTEPPQLQAEPDASDVNQLVEHHQRIAQAAMMLKLLGHPDQFWKALLENDDEFGVASVIIARSPLIFEPGELVERLAAENRPESKRRLVLALGELANEGGDRAEVESAATSLIVVENTLDLVEASRWCLQQWGVPSTKKYGLRPGESGVRAWYDTSYEAMAVFRPGGREPFALANREVTKRQWQEFLDDIEDRKAERPPAGPSADVSQGGLKLQQARAYCNWRTAQDIDKEQKYYTEEKDDDGTVRFLITQESKTKIGYRLPTPEEWLRAWTYRPEGNAWFGASPAVVEDYGWFESNARQSLQSGRLKPNRLGLSDIHGNAKEWCDTEPHDQQLNSVGYVCGTTVHTLKEKAVVPTPPNPKKLHNSFKFPTTGFRLAQNLPER